MGQRRFDVSGPRVTAEILAEVVWTLREGSTYGDCAERLQAARFIAAHLEALRAEVLAVAERDAGRRPDVDVDDPGSAVADA